MMITMGYLMVYVNHAIYSEIKSVRWMLSLPFYK